MRLLLLTPLLAAPLLAAPLLAACHGGPGPGGALLAAEGASVAVLGRGIGDTIVSAVTGKDCSIVRLEQGRSWCAPEDRLPAPPYCTRSLGVVDCWASPALLPAPGRGVADQPRPNPAQERWLAARWPKSINAELAPKQ